MPHKTARQWLETLVAFDTTSSKTNIPLIECVAAYLESCGVKPLILRSPDGIHANLLATLPAADGSTTGGLVLSGHSDVVPVTGQRWDSDPFTLTERNGKLYGRGSCDMKGYIAIVLSLVPEWLAKPRSKPLHIALTHSEETNLAGVRELVKAKGSELAKCDGCIIGEPTGLDLVIGHKGIYSNRVEFTGKSAHSSLQTDGYNAIEPASRLLSFLFALRDRFAKEGPFDNAYKIPHTTLCPSIVNGGIAMNTIPDTCTVGFEFRNVPTHDAQAIQKEVFSFIEAEQARAREACPEASIVPQMAFVPEPRHYKGDPNWPVAKAVQAASAERREPMTVNYYTEASTLVNCGLATVVWGPGDIGVAHKANEYMPLDEFEKGRHVLDRVVRIMCLEVAPSQL